MKKIRKFFKETKTGGLLGCKRRSQFKMMLIALPLLMLMFALPFIVSPKSGAAMLAVAPIAGMSLVSKAKKEEDMTEEEKQALGTIQKAVCEAIEQYRKGTITDEELQKQLDKIKKEVNEENETNNQELTKRIKEAVDLITEVQETVGQLSGQIEEEKKKSRGFGINGKSSVIKSIHEALESEKFKTFVNNAKGTNSGEFELKNFSKDLVRKGTVSFTNSYTGTIIPAYQSDVMVSEVNLRKLNLRDFMNVVDASDEEFTSYAFTRMYDIDRAAAAMSENGELPEGSFKVKEVVCETHRIGWHLPMSKRMLRKLRILENRIMNLMPSGMFRQENFQIMYGDGNNPNFQGIVELCPTETVLTGTVYDIQTAGSVKSIEQYDGGAATKVNFMTGFAKIETGMKITFSGFASGSLMNGTFEALVYNDSSVVVPVAYAAVTDAYVQANVKFKVENVFGNIVVNPNIGDALQCMVAYLNFLQYMPNLIIMNPIDYCALNSMKDATGRKLFNEYVSVENGIPYFGGVIPIAQLDCIKRGFVLAGDFFNGCELIDTQRGYMEFAEDVKTKLTNQVESIISEEVIFCVTVPEAFMYADISNVIAYIEASSTFSMNINSTIVGPLNAAGTAVQVESLP